VPPVDEEIKFDAAAHVKAHLSDRSLFPQQEFSPKCYRCHKDLGLSEEMQLTWNALRQTPTPDGGVKVLRLQCMYLAGRAQCEEVEAAEEEAEAAAPTLTTTSTTEGR
jgi:hypothetical protein